MRKTLLFIGLIFIFFSAKSQYDIDGDYKISGKVGIGIATPSTPLHLYTNQTTETNILTLQNIGAWGNSQLHSIIWKDQANGITGGIGLQYDGNGNVDFKIHSLYNGSYKNSSNVSFVVKGTGNVGIGTNTASRKLTVFSETNGPIAEFKSTENSGNQGLFISVSTLSPYVATLSSSGINAGALAFRTGTTERMRINTNGSVGIGTIETGTHKLAVEGTIGAREIKVEADGWSDFVFIKDYELRDLSEVENFIEENNHLPDIPSENEVKEDGIQLGEMNAKLLQKIEELTLYMIEQNKKTENLIEKVDKLESENELLKNEINILKIQ